ncbi:hypothetical protein PCYB_001370 [Plasmodium cynomolgi strain B]|uniref:CYIR protein n=1 Tax=Plasmodium cynomolgi (strain B) TaxID=1120755 RepID=K6UZH6_PLACD|nr:hypothetical protein PCYB_001370 [Plasmodium cynomolgi strain B]GAB69389.1 hypothetical protein PCYB_001370 [Plasmodium cynomolgi strain B]
MHIEFIKLKTFPSYDVYEELNKESSSNKYDNYCKDKFKSESERTKLDNLCKKLARNLKGKLSNIEDKEENQDDHCLYFMYWTYDEMSKIFTGNSKNIYEIGGFANLLKIVYDISSELRNEDYREKSAFLNNEFSIYNQVV